ncbi:membrane protein insertase YidC [Aerococcus sp. 1KP-2016]|uniref:membrane protein insertase YidC n=1 Tax=Aerococcus sp. 1KP-2016 TaxID=1981982 RepID=UPI000B98186A|nr:membrane protein insertase YidC [Aerococcus sp. 1KP-2016]OYQ66598.1 hypothetical protein B9P78_05975 [Aerococcus sp. 1KP-2016]
MSSRLKNKRLSLMFLVMSLVVFLGGCANPNNPDGILYRLTVTPIDSLITWIANQFSGNYGIAIIIITILIRVILLPLTLNQLKSSTRQQIRMQAFQPHLKEIQERQKNATTQEEKMRLATEQQAFMRENNINILGGMGCLPLLLQLPIISGLYTAIRVSDAIASSQFLGISLGSSNLVLAIVTIIMYVIQSFISLQGVPEEQKAQMRSALFMTPIMMGFIVFTTPAGLTLYFLTGAIWSILQTLFTTFYYRPKIQAEVDKELAENPIKVVTPSSTDRKDVTNSVKEDSTTTSIQKQLKTSSRNAGKQRK